MVVLDATTLLLLVDPSAKPPLDKATGRCVERCMDRIAFLVKTLDDAGLQVLVPTPVLAEILVRAGAAKQQFLNEISNTYAFRIVAFDEKAAVELAMMLEADGSSGRQLTDVETKAKLKFDRQILSIAKVNGARRIYSDDRGVGSLGEKLGIEVVRTADLPLPPVEAQQDFFDPSEAQANGPPET